MRLLLLIPVVFLLVAGACFGAAAVMGWKTHGRELIAAAVICSVSGDLALLPIVLLRKSDAATVSQAGLAGTVVHMFLTLILASIVWMQKLADRSPFMFALLAFFWVTLIVVVLVMAKLVRGAAASVAKT